MTHRAGGGRTKADPGRWVLGGPRLWLIFAAVAYSGVGLEAILGYPLDPALAYLSELAASDQSAHWLFRSADIGAGVVMVLAAIVLRTGSGPGRRRFSITMTLAGLLVFGVGTVADALTPLECAPSGSVACVQAEVAGAVGLAHHLHGVTSTFADVGGTVMAAGIFCLGWMSPVGRSRALVSVGLVAVASSAFSSLMAIPGEFLSDPLPGVGIAQRVQTVAFSICLGCVVSAVTRGRGQNSPRTEDDREQATSGPNRVT